MKNGDGRIEEMKENYKTRLSKSFSSNGLTAIMRGRVAPYEIQEALNCIHEHLYDQRVTVGWMKEQCGINGHNFSSKFKHYMGQTPKLYILHHLIETAKLLLNETDSSILAIALATGFSGQASFTNAFKRATGITPAKWRKGLRME